MVWLARALGYSTLALTATLLPRTHAVNEEAPTFVTAYPELVDVRPLAFNRPWSPFEDTAQDLLQDVRQRTSRSAHTLRKESMIADAWVSEMRRTKRLSLRDPFDISNAARSIPCNFTVTSRRLACNGHASAEWSKGTSGCSRVMCHGTRTGARRRHRA